MASFQKHLKSDMIREYFSYRQKKKEIGQHQLIQGYITEYGDQKVEQKDEEG